jgi:hypothetical protein
MSAWLLELLVLARRALQETSTPASSPAPAPRPPPKPRCSCSHCQALRALHGFAPTAAFPQYVVQGPPLRGPGGRA